MTTVYQLKIDEGRMRTLDDRLAARWPKCRPCTTRVKSSVDPVTHLDNPPAPAEMMRIETFIEGYNAAMDDARRLIGPPGLGEGGRWFRGEMEALALAKRFDVGQAQPSRRNVRDGRWAARAAAEALFKGGKGNG